MRYLEAIFKAVKENQNRTSRTTTLCQYLVRITIKFNFAVTTTILQENAYQPLKRDPRTYLEKNN